MRICESSAIKATQSGVAKLHKVLATDFVVSPTDSPYPEKLASGGSKNAKIKRTNRSVEQVKEFLQCVSNESYALGSVIGSIQGCVTPNRYGKEREKDRNDVNESGGRGTPTKEVNLRRYCTTRVLDEMKKCKGLDQSAISISIDGLYGGENANERGDAIKSLLDVADKSGTKGVRILSGGGGAPWDVLRAVELSVDIIDSTFPFDMAEDGYVTQLSSGKEHVNVRDRGWETSDRALADRCECLVCNGFCRKRRLPNTVPFKSHVF